jgi:hypothetical protein
MAGRLPAQPAVRWAGAAAAARLRKVLYTSCLRVEVLRMQSCEY